MSYDDLIILIKVAYEDDTDENGVEVCKRTLTPVLCNKKSVSNTAFFRARAEGLKPSYIFTIHAFEYDGQQEVEFEGKRYRVIHTVETNDALSLTVEEVIGNRNNQ